MGTDSEAAPDLIATGGSTGRARLLLEGSGSLRLPNGAELTPTLEAALR